MKKIPISEKKRCPSCGNTDLFWIIDTKHKDGKLYDVFECGGDNCYLEHGKFAVLVKEEQ